MIPLLFIFLNAIILRFLFVSLVHKTTTNLILNKTKTHVKNRRPKKDDFKIGFFGLLEYFIFCIFFKTLDTFYRSQSKE